MKKPKKIINVCIEDIVASLDRVNLSDRSAMFVIGAVAQALGTPVSDISLSRRNRLSFFFFSTSSCFALG
jgi:hypothetical protein